MTISLVQVLDTAGMQSVVLTGEDGTARKVGTYGSTYALAFDAIAAGMPIGEFACHVGLDETVDLNLAADENRLQLPISHDDPAHVYLTGTGLTHLGSAEGRDKMHKTEETGGQVTDSMRMFIMGLEGGKPSAGEVGAQPEWFYKGNGAAMVATGQMLPFPDFAEDASEEPELAAIYIIDYEGNPVRIGFCLANEFSDHKTEKTNYLWLAHSKLRHAAIGAEILLGDLPGNICGSSKIYRNGALLWEREFLTGEDNMSHTIANLEHHHFKYAQFCNPGDVHIHFFGTATLSFADGIETREGDIFEISAEPFRIPLSNKMQRSPARCFEIHKL